MLTTDFFMFLVKVDQETKNGMKPTIIFTIKLLCIKKILQNYFMKTKMKADQEGPFIYYVSRFWDFS